VTHLESEKALISQLWKANVPHPGDVFITGYPALSALAMRCVSSDWSLGHAKYMKEAAKAAFFI